MMRFFKKAGFTAGLALIAFGVWGAIVYDDELNAIKVTDFPEEVACTLERLAEMDGHFGWGKVSYDRAAGTCTVNCNLIIGDNDGTETYFQIGSSENPGETLIMKGILYVAPYYISGEHPAKYIHWWHYPEKVNRLTLGCKNESNVKTTLKFACEPGKKYNLVTGMEPEAAGKGKRGKGGQIVMYNGIITALTPKKGYEIPILVFRGNGFVMENSEISHVNGMMTYGAGKKNYSIKNSVFAYGGTALICGKQRVAGCTFRNCGIAVLDYSSADAELTDCVFENNLVNFKLRHPAKKQHRIVCVDCTFGKPAQSNSFELQRKPKAGEKLPVFILKRHLIVEVTDASGKAVPGAEVKIEAEQTGLDSAGIIITTDAAGKTPGKGDKQAALLTEVIKQCVEDSKAPKVMEFTYTVEASTGDRKVVVKGIKPDKSWKVVGVVLK